MERYLIIGLIIIMFILLLIHLYKPAAEGMTDATTASLPNLQSCPAGLNRYTTDISINCCDGDVTGNNCSGAAKCTLSGSDSRLPRCIDYYMEYLDKLTKRNCPTNSRFFEGLKEPRRPDGITGYCTTASLTRDFSARLNPSETPEMQCIVFKSPSENESNPNSCYNKKLLEKIVVPTADSKRLAASWGSKYPVFFGANYFDDMKSMSCLDRDTFINAITNLKPDWRQVPDWKQWVDNWITYCDTEKKRMDAKKDQPSMIPANLKVRII